MKDSLVIIASSLFVFDDLKHVWQKYKNKLITVSVFSQILNKLFIICIMFICSLVITLDWTLDIYFSQENLRSILARQKL